jgi:hypothetical protein
MYAYNGNRATNLGFNDFDFPPAPPSGMFNARFHSGKFIEGVPPDRGLVNIPIEVQDAVFPLTFSWNIPDNNGVRYWLVNRGGRIELNGSGEIVIGELQSGAIQLQAGAIPCDIGKAGLKHEKSETLSLRPTKYTLHQNAPNPFNPTTSIRYDLPDDNFVTLRVYNSLGQEVATLVNEFQSGGFKSVTWNAENVPSGLYFYRLTAGSYTEVKKMLLMK